jgi:hypothetical protein
LQKKGFNAKQPEGSDTAFPHIFSSSSHSQLLGGQQKKKGKKKRREKYYLSPHTEPFTAYRFVSLNTIEPYRGSPLSAYRDRMVLWSGWTCFHVTIK